MRIRMRERVCVCVCVCVCGACVREREREKDAKVKKTILLTKSEIKGGYPITDLLRRVGNMAQKTVVVKKGTKKYMTIFEQVKISTFPSFAHFPIENNCVMENESE